MIIQPQHQHHQIKKQVSKVQSQSLSQSKIIKSPSKIQQKQTLFYVPQIIHETASYNFHIDDLRQMLKISNIEVSAVVSQVIEQRRKFSQERIYQAVSQNSIDFVTIHMKDVSISMKLQMHNLFEQIHNEVQAGIWDGRYSINDRKYVSNVQKEQNIIAHITQELVRRNLNEFKEQLTEADNKSSLNVTFNKAHSQSAKTKKAQQFIRKMQEQQIRHKQVLQKQRIQRQVFARLIEQEKKQKEGKKKQQKQELLKKRMQQYNQIKKLQQQRKKQINQQFKKIKSSYSDNKPLYKLMEENFRKSQKQEQKKKFKIMQQIMNNKQSITFQQIQQHMEKYDELRQQNQEYRQQKRQLKQHQMEIIANKKYFRSKFYSLALKHPEDQQQKQKQIATSKFLRKLDYSQSVKRSFMPQIDQNKHRQLQQLIKKMTNKKRQSFSSRKHMEQGKKNLQKLHLLIGELRAKNKIKINQSLQTISQPQSAPKRYKNYLDEIKMLNSRKSQTINYQQLIQTKGNDYIKMEAQRKQNKARQKQRILKTGIHSMDFHTHMQKKGQVQKDYIDAAKAKIAILKKYKQQQISSDDQ